MLRLSLLILPLALSAAPAPADAPGGVIVETATGARLSPEALAERLAGVDVAILGELHDNPAHHRRQAWLIERIDPAGVAFEMVDEAAEGDLDALRAEEPDADARLARLPEVLDWASSGWPEFALYRPVFAAAGDARLTGGGVARARLERAMQAGAAAADPEQAGAAGLDQPLPDDLQAALEAEMIASHCDALPAEMAPMMVEAQRLRDARLAAATLRALGPDGGEAGDGGARGGPAVLITGNGHARTDVGVPAVLARLAPELTVLSLGQVETADGTPEEGAADEARHDFLWYSTPAEREDPCAAFAE